MAFDFFRGEEAFTWNTRGWQAVFNLAETYSSRRIPPTFLSERLRKRESAGNRQFLIRVSGGRETRVSPERPPPLPELPILNLAR